MQEQGIVLPEPGAPGHAGPWHHSRHASDLALGVESQAAQHQHQQQQLLDQVEEERGKAAVLMASLHEVRGS